MQKKMIGRECDECKAEFLVNDRKVNTHRFCSDSCRDAWNNKNRGGVARRKTGQRKKIK